MTLAKDLLITQKVFFMKLFINDGIKLATIYKTLNLC